MTPHPARMAKVDCGKCHEAQAREHAASVHGRAEAKGDSDAPGCAACHGTHDILSVRDPRAAVSRLKADALCIDCHARPELVRRHRRLPGPEFVRRYLLGVHGRGVHEKGLIVSASCIDCHGAHTIRAGIDADSSVNRNNVPDTCAKCHAGILEEWKASAHGQRWSQGKQDGPVCTDCHHSHAIEEPRQASFRKTISDECGGCHQDKARTFGDTFHGKATSLGYVVSAKCSDCHTAHRNLPESDPASSVNPANLRETCGACHPGADSRFVQYQPHLDPEDARRSPLTHGVALFMKWLLLATFTSWGIHTLMWLQRSIVAIVRKEMHHPVEDEKWVRRFTSTTILTHIVIVVSFLGLVGTGLPLKYHYTTWAKTLEALWGGTDVARYLHRVFALVTFGYAAYHLRTLWHASLRRGGVRWLFSPDTLLPRPKDLVDLRDNLRWFLYLGPPPSYGRFTYFEKFDYFAVFWGIPIIGTSGLMLWFPQLVTRVLPGIALNVAMVVHSEEALLAFGFIFTVHFFHAHMRPENFPFDPVIFTGSMPLSRFKRERSEEYAARQAAGTLDALLVPPPDPALLLRVRVFGFSSLAIGLLLVGAVFATVLGLIG